MCNWDAVSVLHLNLLEKYRAQCRLQLLFCLENSSIGLFPYDFTRTIAIQ